MLACRLAHHWLHRTAVPRAHKPFPLSAGRLHLHLPGSNTCISSSSTWVTRSSCKCLNSIDHSFLAHHQQQRQRPDAPGPAVTRSHLLQRQCHKRVEGPCQVLPRHTQRRSCISRCLAVMVDAGAPDSGLMGLLATCLCMFLAALCCGLLPAVLPLKEQQLRTVNAVGAGLLIGSALCVILPEGFESLHEAQEHAVEAGRDAASLPSWSAGLALLLGFASMLLLDGVAHSMSGPHSHGAAGGRSSDGGINSTDSTAHQQHDDLQLLLEQQPQQDGAVTDTERQHSLSYSGAPRKSYAASSQASPSSWNGTHQALLGLMVHAFADGLAVGASSLARQPSVSLTVAFAMVLHKGPVAVGVTSILRGAGWPWAHVQQGLLAFALTSPLSAVLTYALLSHAAWLTSGIGVALAILYSGGTFLYASCIHIFPSVFSSENGSSHSHAKLIALCSGMLLPLLLSASMGHHHH